MANSTQKRKLDFTSDDIEEESTGYEKMPKMSFTCKNCKETFRVNSKEEMRVHYIEAHKKSPVDCDVCQKLFPSKMQLEEHKKAKHNYPCLFPSCGRILAKPIYLEQHMKSNHGDGNQFKCELCPEFAFDTEKSYQQHVKEIHEANANIRKCPVCQYKATGDDDLAKHSEILFHRSVMIVERISKQGGLWINTRRKLDMTVGSTKTEKKRRKGSKNERNNAKIINSN